MGQNERNKFYYDMLDEAEKIDSVVHDLIGTLNEEDLDKGIFVGKKENGEHVEQEFHLVAKDMKKTVVDLLGSANENEIVVGGPEQTLKGSNVYFNRQDDIDTVTEIFNTSDVILDGKNSYVKFTPTEFHFTYKTTIDEQTHKEALKDGSRLHLTPSSTYIGGDSALGASFFLSQSNSGCTLMSSDSTQRGYLLNINPTSVSASCSGSTRFSITPDFAVIHTKGTTYNEGAQLYLSDTAKITIGGKSTTHIYGNSTTNIYGSSQTNIYGSSQTNIFESARITAKGTSQTSMLDAARTEFSQNSKTTMTGTSWTVIGGNSRIAIDGSSRLTMHGAPVIDITGQTVSDSQLSFVTDAQEYAGNENPRIYIHDYVQIHIDNGKKPDGTYYFTEETIKEKYPQHRNLGSFSYTSSALGHRRPAAIIIHDFPLVDLSQACAIKGSGVANLSFEDSSTISFKNNAFFEMNTQAQAELTGYSGLYMDGYSVIRMNRSYDVNSDRDDSHADEYSPVLSMNGKCFFTMYSRREKAKGGGPVIAAEDKAFMFIGDGMDFLPSPVSYGRDPYSAPSATRYNGPDGSWASKIGSRLSNLEQIKDHWGEKVYIGQNFKDDSPCFKIGGNITLNLDTQAQGGVYIKVGNPSYDEYKDYHINVFLEGDTFIRTGEHNKIDLNGGWFQTTGNPHTEIHNNTRFIFRGNLTEPVPWLDGLKFETVKKGTTENSYEWESFNSSRHVKPADSPVAQMYDSSNFCMRGVWKVPEEFEKTITLTITQEDHSQIYETLKDETGPIQVTEVHPGLDEDLKKVYATKPYDSSDTRGFCIEKEDGTREFVPNSFMEEISSVKSIDSVEKDTNGNIVLRGVKISVKPKKPANWDEKAVKIPNNPLLEVIENAEVRIRGNVYIDISDEGISIGKVGEANQETELFKFTIEDIKTVYEAVKSGNLSTEAKPMVYQVKENINVAGDSYVDTVVENVRTAESIVCQIPEGGFTELNDEWFEKHTVEMPETSSETSSDS